MTLKYFLETTRRIISRSQPWLRDNSTSVNPVSTLKLSKRSIATKSKMHLFRQLFDKESSTYTYLLGDTSAGVAVLIDTVKEQVNRELKLIKELGFKEVTLLSTHVHADHITGNALIKTELGPSCKSIISKYYDNAKSDVKVGHGETMKFGSIELEFRHTPGHTKGCLSIVDHKNRRVFTGDTLLIRGCGRTDFQEGSSEQLYESVHTQLYSLPRDYLVYPAHDYNGRTCSSIGEEMDFNYRLSVGTEEAEFLDIMDKLNLMRPKMIDVAVPQNLNCGY